MTVGEYKEHNYHNFFYQVNTIITDNIEAFQHLKSFDFNFNPLYERLTIKDVIPLNDENLLIRDFL